MNDTVRLKINLDGTQAQRVLDQLERDQAFNKLRSEVRSFGRELDVTFSKGPAAGGAAGLAGSFGSLSGSLRVLGGALAAVNLAQFAGETASAGLALNKVDTILQTVFGSSADAAREFDFVRETAARLSLELDATARGYALLSASTKGTALEGQATRDIFLSVVEAGGKLKLSGEEINGVLTAFRQIASGATLQTDELNQIAERIPGAFNIAARALGVTTGEVKALVAEGRVATADFLPKFAAETRKAFGTDAQTEIQNYNSGVTLLNNNLQLLAKTSLTPLATEGDKLVGVLARVVGATNDALAAFDRLFEDYDQSLEDLGNGIFRSRRDGKLFEQRGDRKVPLQQVAYNDAAAITRVSRGDIRNVSPLAPKPIVPDVAALVPKPAAPSGPTGAALLGMGAPAADPKVLAARQRELVALQAQLNGLTEEQQVRQSILNGELRGRNVLEQEAALAVARTRDQITAQAEAQRRQTRAAKDALQLPRDELADAIVAASSAAEADLQRLTESVLTPVEAFRRELAEINRMAADGTLEQIAQRVGVSETEIRNRMLARAAEAASARAGIAEDPVESVRDATSEMTSYAEQAARNMQDAFAQFLFDPFEGGVKGLVSNFARAIAQMAAQAAASNILGKLDLGGIFGRVLGGLSGGSAGGATGGALLGPGGNGFTSIGSFASGGLIRGPGTGTSDSVPLWGSDGEFMINAAAVRKVGVRFLEALNKGRMPGFAAGGLVSAAGRVTVSQAPAIVTAADRTTVNVDARNATDPAMVRAAVQAGVSEALARVDRNRSRRLPASVR